MPHRNRPLRERIGKRVVVKYPLLQLPAFLCLLFLLLTLQRRLALPGWALWTTVALWVEREEG